jgi:hypothetical protein
MSLIQAKDLVIQHLGNDADEHWPIVLELYEDTSSVIDGMTMIKIIIG